MAVGMPNRVELFDVTTGNRLFIVQEEGIRDHPEELRDVAFWRHTLERVRQRHTWMMVAGRVGLLLEQSLRARRLSAPAHHPRAE